MGLDDRDSGPVPPLPLVIIMNISELFTIKKTLVECDHVYKSVKLQ